MRYEIELIADKRDIEPIIAEASLNLDECFSLPRCTLSLHSWLFINVGASPPIDSDSKAPEFIGDCNIESITSNAINVLEESKSSSSITSYIQELSKIVDQNHGLIEVRFSSVVDPLKVETETKEDGSIRFICTSSCKFDETYVKNFVDTLYFCVCARKSGKSISVSFGFDMEQIAYTSKNSNNEALFLSFEGDSVYCSAARVSITCASVFAFTLAELVSEAHYHSSPLATFDRLLPGISQICCLKTMCVLASRVKYVLNERAASVV